MYRILLTFCAFCALQTTCGEQSSLYLDEIRSLSELPMDKLIQIKSSLASENGIMDDETNEEEDADMSSRTFPLDLPMALPLRKTTKEPTRRYEDYDEKGKDTKISKIFQLAITALSFLAFGGYLLTLIIMSIRRNTNGGNGNGNGNGDGNGDGNGNVIIFSNLQSLSKLKRPKRNILMFDPRENNFETDRLYEGMIMLSRSYALYK